MAVSLKIKGGKIIASRKAQAWLRSAYLSKTGSRARQLCLLSNLGQGEAGGLVGPLESNLR